MAKTCCPTDMKPVVSGYEKKGTIVEDPAVSNYYIVGEGTKGVVVVPDIFGNHPNAYQVADTIAARGFVVAMPDYWRGNPWPTDKFPPAEDDAEWPKFLARAQDVGPMVADIKFATQVLKEKGAVKVGAIGMCAGAKYVMAANAEGIVSCCVGPHPSFLTVEDAQNAQGPVCLLPSKEDPALLDVKEELEKKSFAAKNIFKRYDELNHGYLGARGHFDKASDYSSDERVKLVNEAFGIAISFFEENLA